MVTVEQRNRMTAHGCTSRMDNSD